MSESQLSQAMIQNMVDNISPSAMAHSDRCKKIAAFILNLRESRPLFYAHKKRYTTELINAVGCHDIGKAFIPHEFQSERFCIKPADKKIYKSHTLEAAKYIKETSGIFEKTPASFDRYLFECATLHHEHFDGTGYPNGYAGKKIPLTARLCTAVNFIDHALGFDHNSKINMVDFVEKIEKASGTIIDPRIGKYILQNLSAFESLCIEMLEDFKQNPEVISHLEFKYSPLYSATDYSLVGYDVETTIYDADFGKLSGEVFRSATAEKSLAVKLDKIICMHTLNQTEKFIEKNIDFGKITLYETARSLSQKNYVQEISKLLSQYGVLPNQIILCIPEEVLVLGPPELIDTIKTLSKIGIYISINNFGAVGRTFDIFEKFKPNEIRIGKNFIRYMEESNESYQTAAAVIAVARNLGVNVACTMINSIGEEKNLAGMGVNILGGILYGGPRSALEIEEDSKVGVTDGN